MHLAHEIRQLTEQSGVPYERLLNTTRGMPRAAYQRLLLESLHAAD